MSIPESRLSATPKAAPKSVLFSPRRNRKRVSPPICSTSRSVSSLSVFVNNRNPKYDPRNTNGVLPVSGTDEHR